MFATCGTFCAMPSMMSAPDMPERFCRSASPCAWEWYQYSPVG